MINKRIIITVNKNLYWVFSKSAPLRSRVSFKSVTTELYYCPEKVHGALKEVYTSERENSVK